MHSGPPPPRRAALAAPVFTLKHHKQGWRGLKPVGAIQTEKFEKDGKQYEKRTGEYLGKRANFWIS